VRLSESGATDLDGVRRFNEAIDEAVTESTDRFARQTDLFRDQFIGVLSHDLRTHLAPSPQAPRYWRCRRTIRSDEVVSSSAS
jgi:hypothetical protein